MVRIGGFGRFGRIPQIRRDGAIERTGRTSRARQMGRPGGADSAPGRGIIVVGNLAFQGQQTRRKAAARIFRACILANRKSVAYVNEFLVLDKRLIEVYAVQHLELLLNKHFFISFLIYAN